ncbi:MAG: GNAT family N-acetyltransferase [Asgard group archaeon]|nr:GNAT family N-acetyltransferase [Asgard group archaeon]
MEYRIEEYKPKEVPDDFWEGYFEFIETNHRYHNPNDPLPNREAIIQRQKADIPNFHVKRWIAYTSEDKVVGWGGFGAPTEDSPEYEENKHLCQLNIAVLPDYHRKGIGTALLKVCVQKAQSLNRTVIETGTDHDSGRAFLKKHGAEFTIEAAENRLELEDVDWDLMQSWVDEGPKRAEDVTIESFYDCPEEILDEYCEMYTEALNMQPLGDSEHRANIDGKFRRQIEKRFRDTGNTYYTLISREKDGRISGMTEILYDPREGHRIVQELTGVRPEFRGRGLGKWLKGKMILHIKDTYPDVQRIITGNAEANAPMLSINERMGFKKYKGAEGYKFQTEDLAKRLELNK